MKYHEEQGKSKQKPYFSFLSKWLPSQVSPLKDPAIKLTPTGFSMQGLPINLQYFPGKMQHYLRWLLSFMLITQSQASSEQSYLFKTLNNTIYKLWFSGVENLSQVITQLNNGACNTTMTDQIPADYVMVEGYYEHGGGNVPVYAAVLTRDKFTIPDLGVEKCVSDLITMAHEAWQAQINSGETIGIAVGVIAGILICIGVTSGVILYCKKHTKKDDEGSSITSEEQFKP